MGSFSHLSSGFSSSDLNAQTQRCHQFPEFEKVGLPSFIFLEIFFRQQAFLFTVLLTKIRGMSEEPNSPRNGSNPESPVPPQLMKIKTESLITDNYNSDLGELT